VNEVWAAQLHSKEDHSMRRISLIVAAVIAIVAPATVFGLRPNSQIKTEQRILFAVWAAQKGKQPEGPILDPIAIFEGSKLSKLPLEEYDKPEVSDEEDERFYKTYYAPGKQYPLLFGGSELGTAKVVEVTGLGCVSLAATVRTSVSVPNGQYALAMTGLAKVGLHANWRQKPTLEQEAEFSKAAAAVLEKNGAKNVSAADIKIKNLRATRLGEKRPTALIGTIVTYKAGDAGHNLFLALEQKGAEWEVLVASYRKTTDLEDHTDDIVENFVDQVDLVSGGTDEIITIRGYYESWDYAVYRLEKGAWTTVYQGGGGGC
jgi:hypothetical protein